MGESIEADEEGKDGGRSRPPLIVFDEFPPGYPSARLRPRRAGFRFTRPVQFRPRADDSPVIASGFGNRFRKAS